MIISFNELKNMKTNGELRKFAQKNGYSISAMYRCLAEGRDYRPRIKSTIPIWEIVEAEWIYRQIHSIAASFAAMDNRVQLEDLKDYLLNWIYDANISNKKKSSIKPYIYKALKNKCFDYIRLYRVRNRENIKQLE